ncbi:hypothetical protein HD806DRAFT_539148 [Xylariaceae sp. AK1471]|nr:hypothetical protein HD806DRAFT_539148 [Xylariaceae sp. AK1471]
MQRRNLQPWHYRYYPYIDESIALGTTVDKTTVAEDNNTDLTAAAGGADDFIEVDLKPNLNPDEGYKADSLSTAMMSISSSIQDNVFENNRRYHKSQEGCYLIPNDNEEQQRENMKYALVLHFCGGKLHLAPLDHPQNILDIGTGTGTGI